MLCYFNGSFIPVSECNVHISDLAIQRGYGVFDYFRSREGKLLWLDDYMERLFHSIGEAALDFDLDEKAVKAIILDLHHRNNLPNSFFKIIVTGGYSDNYASVQNKANLIILNDIFEKPNEELYTKGADLISQRFHRPDYSVKSINYFSSVKLQKKMAAYSAVDVLYYDTYLFEAARSNIFCIKGNTVFTPSEGILLGITRKNILKHFQHNFDIRVEQIPSKTLFDFDEIFITSSAKDILPIVRIDGKPIGNELVGEITKDMIKLFKELF